MLYKNIIKPILFSMNPERAHNLAIGGLKWAARIPGALAACRAIIDVKTYPEMETDLWGIRFYHPLGLAAGLDKNAEAVEGLAACGFAFIEVGTVTPRPQPGNDKPRLFRLREDRALINRMGFNNEGSKAMAERLKRSQPFGIPIAVNIGKNKATPNERAADDYRQCLRDLYGAGDFFIVNISSPNTPDLRDLQHGESLQQLLSAVREEIRILADRVEEKPKPFLVKIAPDVSDEQLDAIVATAAAAEVSGIIATNTTVERAGLQSPLRSESGGLSGRPLKERSTAVIRRIYEKTNGSMPIIGVGGIESGDDAYEKIRAGASLIEIYTSFIYGGPGTVRAIHERLLHLLKADGFRHISEAVGVDVRGRHSGVRHSS